MLLFTCKKKKLCALDSESVYGFLKIFLVIILKNGGCKYQQNSKAEKRRWNAKVYSNICSLFSFLGVGKKY